MSLTSKLIISLDSAFDTMTSALAGRLRQIGSSIHAAEFRGLLDPLVCQTLKWGFAEAGAHEGTVWLLDEAGENLEPAYNTGPDAEKIVGSFKQPLGAGLVCMVFASQQPFLENEVYRNAQQSKLLDSRLQTQTHAMIVVPFHFLHDCRGVVSCVQLKPRGGAGPDPPGFKPGHIVDVQRTVAIMSQLIEFRVLSLAVGWTTE
jgi:hypothetical protein